MAKMTSGFISYRLVSLGITPSNFTPGSQLGSEFSLEADAVTNSTTRRQHWKQTSQRIGLAAQSGGISKRPTPRARELSFSANGHQSWPGEIWAQTQKLSALSLLLAPDNSFVCCAEAAPALLRFAPGAPRPLVSYSWEA